VEVLRKLGLKVFYGDATRQDLLELAGAKQAKVLVITLDDPEKTKQLVRLAQKNWPHLKLLVRAISRPDAYELIEMGIHNYYRDTLDTSLRMGIDALRTLGFRAFQATRSANTFRQHDEEHLLELAQMRHDRKAYISQAKERIHDLEQLMLGELTRKTERDAGWDISSLLDEIQAQNFDNSPSQ
jgi:voltage-gated potassium channel Kch